MLRDKGIVPRPSRSPREYYKNKMPPEKTNYLLYLALWCFAVAGFVLALILF